MYICCECNECFATPKPHVENHGLSTPPYEEYLACPYCGGAYVEAHSCVCCDEWIVGTYIKTVDGDYICANCYTTYEIGEE